MAADTPARGVRRAVLYLITQNITQNNGSDTTIGAVARRVNRSNQEVVTIIEDELFYVGFARIPGDIGNWPVWADGE